MRDGFGSSLSNTATTRCSNTLCNNRTQVTVHSTEIQEGQLLASQDNALQVETVSRYTCSFFKSMYKSIK